MKNSTLLDLFNAIEENTKYKILFKTSIIDEYLLINLSVDDKQVTDLLAMVLPSKIQTLHKTIITLLIKQNHNLLQ
jgi:hypothetical protein